MEDVRRSRPESAAVHLLKQNTLMHLGNRSLEILSAMFSGVWQAGC